jgi:maltose alpha-D-glucosyltransferase/alpha-amylase
VPYLFEREGTSCENLPETHNYLQEMRRFIDDHYPHAVLLAEANQWARDLLPYFGDMDNPEFHLCFHFPVMPRLYMALAQQDRRSVVEVLADTPALPPGTQWATFLRNHDELTLEMVTEEERRFMWDHYSPDRNQRINMGIRRRLAPLLGNDRRKIELLHSLLFSLPGAPVLYYGDEIGMGDNIALFDRNGVRTPMQWTDRVNGGFSNAAPESLYAPIIDDEGFGYKQVNVEAQRAAEESLLLTVRSMIHTFKTLPVLATSDLEWLDDLPRHALCFWRRSPGGNLLALHNLSDQPLTVEIEGLATMRDALQHGHDPAGQSLTLPGYGYRWLTTF